MYRLASYVMDKHGTILIRSTTRKRLKQIVRKGQTHDEIIDELLRECKSKQDSLEGRLTDLHSSESGGQ